MTYEEAIEIMKMHKDSEGCDVIDCPYDGCRQCMDAYDKAIEALEAIDKSNHICLTCANNRE